MKREFLDGKGGYFYTPLVIVAVIALMSLISMIAGNDPASFDNFQMSDHGQSWEEAPAETQELITYFAAGAMWMTTAPLWIASMFVVFFSLLGSLYEDRRDKSILFWKSMPVSDTTEVLTKFLANTFFALGCFLVAAIALHLIMSLLFTLFLVAKGAPFALTFPIAKMIEVWFTAIPLLLLLCLWAAPVFAWLLLVSAAAPRMPFMFAVVPVAVIAIMEVTVLNSHHFIEAFVHHTGLGLAQGIQSSVEAAHSILPNGDFNMRTAEDAKLGLAFIDELSVSNAYAYAFQKVNFWAGLLVAGGLIAATIQLRKRAS